MNPAVLLTVGAEHPLIDLDWSMAVQLGIFVLTALVATRFLFRPYLAMREERAAGIEGAREEAARMTSEADSQLADYESRLVGARTRAQEERRTIRTEAVQRQNEVTEKARQESARAFDDARERAEKEAADAREALMPRADKLAAEVASKLLGREIA